jgi:hypothetical protein
MFYLFTYTEDFCWDPNEPQPNKKEKAALKKLKREEQEFNSQLKRLEERLEPWLLVRRHLDGELKLQEVTKLMYGSRTSFTHDNKPVRRTIGSFEDCVWISDREDKDSVLKDLETQYERIKENVRWLKKDLELKGGKAAYIPLPVQSLPDEATIGEFSQCFVKQDGRPYSQEAIRGYMSETDVEYIPETWPYRYYKADLIRIKPEIERLMAEARSNRKKKARVSLSKQLKPKSKRRQK